MVLQLDLINQLVRLPMQMFSRLVSSRVKFSRVLPFDLLPFSLDSGELEDTGGEDCCCEESSRWACAGASQ